MLAAIKPKSDQLNSDDLIGGPRTITVTDVSFSGGPEQPVALAFEGDGGKPYKPCKSMCRVLVGIWGPDAKAYQGESMTLYRDPAVMFGGLAVGGIRISHMTGLTEPRTMALTASKAKRAPFTVRPLVADRAPEAFTIDDARAAIAAAATLDELKAAWSMKVMAAFRPDIQSELDARKLELAEAANDPRTAECVGLDEAKAAIGGITDPADIDAKVAALLPGLSDDDGADLRAFALEITGRAA